jgi:hypothetical protein
MTTFADREHAIEAHFASLELAAFRERSRRCQTLGLKLAGALNLRGADAHEFALAVGERCIRERSEAAIYRILADVLTARGVPLSAADIDRLARPTGRQDADGPVIDEPTRTWIEFVTSELLSLFGWDMRPALSPAPHH